MPTYTGLAKDDARDFTLPQNHLREQRGDRSNSALCVSQSPDATLPKYKIRRLGVAFVHNPHEWEVAVDRAGLFVPVGTPENSPPIYRWEVRQLRLRSPAGTKEVSPAEPPPTSSPPSPTHVRAVFRPWRDCAGHRASVPPLKRWAIFNRPCRDEEAACCGPQPEQTRSP